MKRLIILALSCFHLTFALATDELTITEKVDKFSGMKTKELDRIVLSPSRFIRLSKLTDKNSNTVTMLTYIKDGKYEFEPKSKTIEFITNNTGYLLINDKQFELGDGIHKSDFRRLGGGGFYLDEYVVYMLKPDVIVELSKVDKLEGRVGLYEFNLTNPQAKAIIQFLQN